MLLSFYLRQWAINKPHRGASIPYLGTKHSVRVFFIMNDDKPTSANRLKKETVVEEIAQKLEDSDVIVLTDYQGLTHKQIEEIKKSLKTSNATLAITKNTLLKISIEKTKKYADLLKDYVFEQPTATLFVKGDFIDALKVLAKANKDFGLPKIKIGIIDGQTLDEASVFKIASLPNKETLLGSLAGMLNSPISGLVFVLNGNIQKLVIAFNEIAKTKPTEVAPVAETPVPAVETTPATEAVAEPEIQAQSEDEAGPAATTEETATEPEPTTTESEEKPAEDAAPTKIKEPETEGGEN